MRRLDVSSSRGCVDTKGVEVFECSLVDLVKKEDVAFYMDFCGGGVFDEQKLQNVEVVVLEGEENVVVIGDGPEFDQVVRHVCGEMLGGLDYDEAFYCKYNLHDIMK